MNKSFFVSFGVVTLTLVIEKLTGLIFTPFLSKVLDKSEFGQLATAYTLASFVLLFVINGQNSALFRELSLWNKSFKFDYLEFKVYKLCFLSLFIVNTLAFANYFLSYSSEYLNVDELILLTAIVSVTFGFLYQIKTSLWVIEGKHLKIMLIACFRFLLIMSSFFLIYNFNDALFARQISEILFNVFFVTCVIYSFYRKKIYRNPSLNKSELNEITKGCFSYGWVIQFSQIGFWVISSSDRLIISAYLGAGEVADYTIMMYLLVFSFVIGSFNTVLSSHYNKCFLQGLDYDKLILLSITLGAVLYLPFRYIIDLNSLRLVTLYSSLEYKDVSKNIVLVVDVLFLYFLYICVSRGLHASKSSSKILYLTIVGALFNFLINIFFVEQYGYIIGAYSSMISYVLMIFGALLFNYKLGIDQRLSLSACLISLFMFGLSNLI
ncbi:lipopolysaccharide biosynthesis protein [Vibrio artabrorum]|uniref:lipopolysaccharide biosynthesis protein n=1 Tax=Vibrio artabrorum TaxID=446374 RepID=UPI0021C260E0|nr:oligosaccharide flippase family protein [Vibrio artabrorum]